MKNKVRIGIAGVGNMGSLHARNMHKIKGAVLSAVCDIDRVLADNLAKEMSCRAFYTAKEMIKSGEVDAIVVATPHFDHTTIGIEGLKSGLHVLVEKPISVHKADCKRLIAAHRNKKQVFGAMFNQRTDPHYIKVRNLIRAGELGAVTRVNWIITDWYRTEAYYKSGGWRATWRGEGGGVLMNQSPHNLDLLWWMTGMPRRVTANCYFGKWHNIEVEDEVTAFLEYPNGATGIFITGTGEAPGTNRLEICGQRGRVVVEHGAISFRRNTEEMTKFSKKTKVIWSGLETWDVTIPAQGSGGQHIEIMQNFVDAIRKGTVLMAPACEGIHSVELANAMIYSSIIGKPVDLPLSAAAYEKVLKKLIAGSKYKKRVVKPVGPVDMSKSFR
jgi:predicted dehydrogenase